MTILSRDEFFYDAKILASLIVAVVCLYFMPFFSISIFIFCVYFIKGRELDFGFFILMSLLLALFASVINPSGEVLGDVVRYYNRYDDDISGNFYSSLYEGKFFQFLLFKLMQALDLSNRFYTFASTFLISFNVVISITSIYKNFGVSIYGIKKNAIFISLMFFFMPSTIFYSFEYILALSFILMATSAWISKKTYLFVFFNLISFLVHPGVLFFIVILFFSYWFSNVRYRYIFSCSALASILLMFMLTLSKNDYQTGFFLIDGILYKINYYVNGPWARYETLGDFEILTYTILRIFLYSTLVFILCNKCKGSAFKKYISFLIIYVMISIVFIQYRTLSLRYIYYGIVLFLPAYIYILLRVRISKNSKYFLLIFSFISAFQYTNYSVYTTMFIRHIDASVLLGDINNLITYKLNVPIDSSGGER